MTGIRRVIGVGALDRGEGDKISDLPMGTNGRKSPLEIIKEKLLKGRFGSGVEITLNRNRNLEYKRDLGFREITLATPGMYDIEFSISGYLTPRDLDIWGDTLFVNESVTLTADTKIFGDKVTADDDDVSDWDGTTNYNVGDIVIHDELAYTALTENKGKNPKDNATDWKRTAPTLSEYTGTEDGSGFGYIGEVGNRLEVPNSMLKKYKEDVTRGLEVTLLYPKRLANPNDFTLDIGTVGNNRHTPKGGADEVSILCGCIFDTGSISYESGGDAGVKFTIDGFALRDYVSIVDDATKTPNYLEEMDEVSQDIFATGCLSILKDKEDAEFEVIAYTDSANFTITNGIEKLAECGELIYSGGVIGSLEIGLEVQTYSNEPDRYLPAMYGVKFEKGTDDKYTNKVYSVAKLPKPISAFRIRSTDASYSGEEGDNYTKFIDIVLRDVYVSGINYSYTMDSKIMDEPTLQPKTGWIAYGYIKG